MGIVSREFKRLLTLLLEEHLAGGSKLRRFEVKQKREIGWRAGISEVGAVVVDAAPKATYQILVDSGSS